MLERVGSGPIGERTVPLIEYGALAMFFLCVCLFGGEVVFFFCFLFFVFCFFFVLTISCGRMYILGLGKSVV